MEKTKEIKQNKIKENGKKEKLTIKMAIEILEREIPEDSRRIQEENIKLTKKQGALEILKQID
tara:strand:- start:855 stop:1043 length:189 start_codon:yes stop_codon:yes gene_type:complete